MSTVVIIGASRGIAARWWSAGPGAVGQFGIFPLPPISSQRPVGQAEALIFLSCGRTAGVANKIGHFLIVEVTKSCRRMQQTFPFGFNDLQ